MTVEERVVSAKSDKELENDLIQEYIPFIISCANKSLNKFITKEDDEFSVAMSAFYEAMQKYEPDKGAYLSFARLIIKNRLTDYLRKEYRSSKAVPFSALQSVDKDGKSVEFDVEDKPKIDFDARYEIEELSYELSLFGISFFDVAKNSPKTRKTEKSCMEVIKYITENNGLAAFLKEKKYIPVKRIADDTGASKKIMERHRSYIIAMVLAASGDYEILRGYFFKGGGRI